jgi:SpoVK/Ycf46/Vps4 family AAA+-type ATPase
MKRMYRKLFPKKNSEENPDKSTKPIEIIPETEEKIKEINVEKIEENSFSLSQGKKTIDDFLDDYSQNIDNDQLQKISLGLSQNNVEFKFTYHSKDATVELLKKISSLFEREFKLSQSIFEEIKLISEKPLLEKDNSIQYQVTFAEPKLLFSELPSITIRKNENFSELEIEKLLNLYTIANPIIEKENSLEEKLSKFGVSVYLSNKDHTWDSIAGYESVKEEIMGSVIMPYKHPEIYEQVARNTRERFETNLSNAILFEGPPGTGKTSFARIIANDVNIPLVYVPIESIMTKWYGESEKNLSQIFDICSENEKGSIIFLDEIDTLGGSREDSSSHEASKRVLSTLLRKMDGFNPDNKTLVLGATNRKNDLDQALLSRFDLSIHMPLPHKEERTQIFSLYAKHLLQEELEELGQLSNSFSGRNIKDICEHSERNFALEFIKTNKTYQGEVPNFSYYESSINYRK